MQQHTINLIYFIKLTVYGILLVSHFSFAANAEYVGATVCQSCHPKEHKQWLGSHHDLAMQEANEKTILGNFNQAHFKKGMINTRFFKKGKHFMVNTEGKDGQLHDFEISYTFGVYPLQQYMVNFPKGNIQVLDIAWDSRTKKEGGQRWFSLHPNENITNDDVLHWTGPNLNWNYMCADCHSTNLKKNYSLKEKAYKTQWDAINVSCEACHGPAAKHVSWAKSNEHNKQSISHISDMGLTIDLSVNDRYWRINKNNAQVQLMSKQHRSAVKDINRTEVELCAKCHSRRSQIDDKFTPGDNFRDHYRPALLTESLYFVDGKIKDEVYVYGSFQQSRMYKAGVTCSDCHNTHTLELKLPGNKVCQQCHLAIKYASSKHTFHAENSSGSDCIACHMPAKTYMGVDERNDHSFRIPRPDLSVQFKQPNACNNCHKTHTAQWAANTIKSWYPKIPLGYQQFSPAIHAIEQQEEDTLAKIYAVLLNDSPTIAKASLISTLGSYPSRQTLTTAMQMLRSKDADTRQQALIALEGFPLQYTLAQIFRSLNDSVKMVRLEAARILSSLARGDLEKEQLTLINRVTEEYEQSLLFTAERPESQLSLAQLYQQLKQFDKAEASFKEAIRLQKRYVPAYINYANFLHQQGDETSAFNILKQGIKQEEDASLYHALGLWYVRNKQKDKALSLLRKSASADINNAHYQYVYAIAVAEKDPNHAIEILLSSLQEHQGNIEILSALSSYYQQLGYHDKAKYYTNKIKKIMSSI